MSDITIIHGDCRVRMSEIADGSVDAIITDPPYGTEAKKDGYGRRHRDGIGQFIEGDSDLSVFEAVLNEFNRILARNSWVAAFCSPKRLTEVSSLMTRNGFPVVGEVVWDKLNAGLGGGIRYQHECVLLAAHGKPTGKGPLISVLRSWAERTNRPDRHPHEKPIDVMIALVTYCTRPGDLVLDPFVGTGSTLVACMKTGRRGIGIELDARYIPLIERRIKAAETPLFAGLLETPHDRS